MKARSLVKMLCILAAIACTVFGGSANAAGRTIRMIIFAAGGPVDFVARTVAAKLTTILDTTVIVEARPGANGIVAANYVASSIPDGTTLLFSSSGLFTISPTLMKLPYDPDKDLVPVGRFVIPVSALAIDANLPVKDLKEFVSYVKASKTPIQFGTPGVGNVTQLWIEELNASAGTSINLVPYKGVAPALTDILGGRLAGTMADMPAFLPLVKAGKLKILGIVGNERSPAAPTVPTIREQGFANVDTLSWYGLFAPSKTPPDLIAHLSHAIAEALADPDVQEKLRAMGMEPAPSSPESFEKTILADRARLAEIIKEKHISIDQ
jgi:tripartite-type tricarboxylate transporter receptor subunit TctC